MVKEAKTVFDTNVTSLVGKKTELANYLKSLYGELVKVEQDVDTAPKGFATLVPQLVNAKILENPDKEIRLSAGMCMCEVLRIYVPDSPWGNEDMLRVFMLFIALIRGLETQNVTSPMGEKMLLILKSLAEVQSCRVPVIMAESGVPRADDVMDELFRTVIQIIRPDHSPEVFKYAVDILSGCIEENKGLSEGLLDILLLPLLPAAKTENSAAYKVVATVLRACADAVQPMLCKVIGEMLCCTDGAEHSHNLEISEELYPLIYELHRVLPQSMRDILPLLTQQLKMEEADIRTKATLLLGKLYTSKVVDCVSENPKEFKEFLGRLNDQYALIRKEMVDVCVSLLKEQPNMVSVIEEHLVKRLRDSEEDIRIKTVTVLLSFAADNLRGLQIDTYEQIASRAVDKKFEVRKAVLVGLSKLYSRHVVAHLSPLDKVRLSDADSLALHVDRDVLKRLQDVPAMVIKSWGFPDTVTKHLVVQLLQEQLLYCLKKRNGANGASTDSEAASEEEEKPDSSALRASALVYLYSSLQSKEEFDGLTAILSFKRRVNEDLADFLSNRATDVGRGRTSGASDDDQFGNTKASLQKLLQLIPLTDKKAGLERIVSNKDKAIYRLLDAAVGTSDTIEEALAHRDDLVKRLDSKTVLAEYFHIVYDFSGPLLCNSTMLEHIFDAMIALDLKDYQSTLCDLLTMLAQVQPKLFHGIGGKLVDWLELAVPLSQSEKSKKHGLRARNMEKFTVTILHISKHIDDSSKLVALTKQLLSHLKEASTPSAGSKLAEVLLHLSITTPAETSRSNIQDLMTRFVKDICKRDTLNVKNSRITTLLSTLASLFTVPSSAYLNMEVGRICAKSLMQSLTPVRGNVMQFILHDVLAKDTEIETKIHAMMLFTAVVASEEECKQIQEMDDLKDRFSPTAALQPRLSINPAMGSAEYDGLVNMLFEVIETNGAKLNGQDVDASSDEQNELFTQAATCVILLMKTKKFADTIEVSQWTELANAFVVDNQETRRRLLSALTAVLSIHSVHPRFLCYPCLFANDTSEISDQAQSALVFAIRRLRRTHDEIETKLLTAEDTDARSRYETMASNTMPEKILPYLLYLLSYHPNFPSSVKTETESDKKAMRQLVKCVRSLFDALQATLRKESNLPFLFKQINQICQSYVDRIDESNIGLHFVTRLASKILQEQIRTSDNVQAFPGPVPLPSELYKRSKAGDAQKALERTVEMVTGAVDALEETDLAIRQAIQAGKSRARAPAATMAAPLSPVATGKASPGSSSKKRSKKSVSPLFEDEGDEEEEDYKDKKRRKIASKPRSSPTVKVDRSKKVAEPAEAPTRALPRRSAKVAVKYAEAEESDREAEQWNEEAGRQHRRSGGSSRDRLSGERARPQQVTSSARRSTTASSPDVSPVLSPIRPQEEEEEEVDIFAESLAVPRRNRSDASESRSAFDVLVGDIGKDDSTNKRSSGTTKKSEGKRADARESSSWEEPAAPARAPAKAPIRAPAPAPIPAPSAVPAAAPAAVAKEETGFGAKRKRASGSLPAIMATEPEPSSSLDDLLQEEQPQPKKMAASKTKVAVPVVEGPPVAAGRASRSRAKA